MNRIHIVRYETIHESSRVYEAFPSADAAEKFAELSRGDVFEAVMHEGFPDVTTVLNLSASVRPSGEVFEQFEDERLASASSPVAAASIAERFEPKAGPRDFLSLARLDPDPEKPFSLVTVKGTNHGRVRALFREALAKVTEAPTGPGVVVGGGES